MDTSSKLPVETRALAEALAQLSHARFISLTTYRRDGRAVATPVGFVTEGDYLLVWTEASTGKVKRIRNNPQVTVASSTFSGQVTGPEWPATAIILPASEEARVREMLSRKYGMTAPESAAGVVLQITIR